MYLHTLIYINHQFNHSVNSLIHLPLNLPQIDTGALKGAMNNHIKGYTLLIVNNTVSSK